MRLSAIPQLDVEQQDLLETIIGRRDSPPPPFLMWAHNVPLAHWVEGLGGHCRSTPTLPTRLRLLSMLITGRHLDCIPMWNAHYDEAVEAGLPVEALHRLARHDPPAFTDDDDRVFFGFADELLRTHHVSDAMYAAAVERFSEAGVLDVIGCLGSFSMSCFALNAFRQTVRPDLGNPFADVSDEVAAPFVLPEA